MDISSSFKAYVKSNVKYGNELGIPNNKNSILNLKNKSSLFYTKVKAIRDHVVQLYTLLLKDRLAYTNYNSNDLSLANINDNEIDCVTKNIINTNLQIIKELKEILKNCTSQQNKEHKKIMISEIEIYLKEVCGIYDELRTLRVKKSEKLKDTKQLDSFGKLNSTSSPKNSIKEGTDESHHLVTQKLNNNVNESLNYEHKVISSEDIQMFEAENEQIFSELNVLTDEIKQIENKVIRIHELQNLFTEKVIVQDKNLENLLTNVVGSTQNVREANEQIRKAIQNNAGFRVWVLFFLLLMSFTLIFLDWYNP